MSFKQDKQKIRILILSWEMLPVYAGGLGVLVGHLVDELIKQGVEVKVLLPHIYPQKSETVISVNNSVKKYNHKKPQIENLEFDLESVKNEDARVIIRNNWPQLFSKILKNPHNLKNPEKKIYPESMPALTKAYAFVVADYLKKDSDFDLILGMDWMSIPAFCHLKNLDTKIPFAFYINSSEYDRGLTDTFVSKASKQVRKLEEKFFKQADFVVSVSYNTEKILLEHYNIDKQKSLVVNNDLNFQPSILGIKNWSNSKNVLFVGRFAAQKGLSFLLDTAEKVVAIDHEVKFILAGDGELIPEIIEDVAQRGLERNCIFTGWVEQDLKKKIYRTSNLFVMPSPSEPFGLTALEAIRSDLPVIASENCGFLGIVPSTPTFKYHDTTHFAQQILFYLHNQEETKKILEKQKNDLKSHSWSKEVKKLINLISSK
jgi:glycogen synthase